MALSSYVFTPMKHFPICHQTVALWERRSCWVIRRGLGGNIKEENESKRII